MVEPKTQSGQRGKEKNLSSLPGIESWFSPTQLHLPLSSPSPLSQQHVVFRRLESRIFSGIIPLRNKTYI
jgi:hypothetical protein